MTAPSAEGRRAELAAALQTVRSRIAAACANAGRDPDEVTLVAVTKTYPATDVDLLAEVGVRDMGESRDQEAQAKAAAVTDRDLRWHFVGRLQTNKARSVVGYAAAVHSVDRTELAAALSAAAERANQSVDVFVQVSLDGDPSRGGVPTGEVGRLADAVAALPALKLRGVMAVAPIGAEPERAFADLASVSGRVRAAHPDATAISAGMSGDYEIAVRLGSTHVRVGSALLGRRSATIG